MSYSVKLNYVSSDDKYSRRFKCPLLSYDAFFADVSPSTQISYVDDFGDECLVNSEEEFAEAIAVMSHSNQMLFQFQVKSRDVSIKAASPRGLVSPRDLRSVKLRRVSAPVEKHLIDRMKRLPSCGGSRVTDEALQCARRRLKSAHCKKRAVIQPQELLSVRLKRVKPRVPIRALDLQRVVLRPLQAPVAPCTQVTAFERNLETLRAMGFQDRDRCIRSLVAHKNVLLESVKGLLSTPNYDPINKTLDL